MVHLLAHGPWTNRFPPFSNLVAGEGVVIHLNTRLVRIPALYGFVVVERK